MDLSTLTPQAQAQLQNTSPEQFLRLTGAFGRPLTEGGTQLETRQRNQLGHAVEKALRETAAGTHYPQDQIKSIWQNVKDYGSFDRDGMGVKRLKEATSVTAMPQLLRFGVQNFLFDGYASVPVIYPDLVRVVASSGAEELYAPLYGVELPQLVGPGQEFGDSRLLGLDLHVPNVKKGRMLTVERELVDDDRTGQIVTRAGQLGERMRYVEEQDVINSIINPSAVTSGYSAAVGNVTTTPNAAYGLSQATLEAADIGLMEILDPLGNKMLVMPDTLLVSPSDKFNAAKLLQSALQPSVPGAAGSQTFNTATSGLTGFAMTTNPLQGLYNLKVSRFMPVSGGLTAAFGFSFLMEAKKSLVFQDRLPLEVLQEATNTGASFERDIYRYRAMRRYAAALIETRYVFRIN